MLPKTVKLRIRVPMNVNVIFEKVPVAKALPLSPDISLKTSTTPLVTLDLTTSKTAEWLNRYSAASSDCCTCCVRG
jgi:hypothetical protein